MDAAPRTTRAFPGYTLAELEGVIASGSTDARIIAEIAARKSGASTTYTVPQIKGGKAQVRIGRM
jgi:hypothetical protein